jgi:tRNA U34 5-carboxymethylaminomethyl modifying enzyme MnmG/GidA
VWALRAQTDKLEYSTVMRRVLEATPNLFMREGMAVDLDIGPNDEVKLSEACPQQPRLQAASTTQPRSMSRGLWLPGDILASYTPLSIVPGH